MMKPPRRGAKVIDWKYKFEINVIDSGPALPLCKRGARGDLLQRFSNPPKSPFSKGGLDGKDR